MPLLFLLFVFLFLYAEVALVIAAGEAIGASGVIALFALSAALGLVVIRRQGLRAYRGLEQAFAAGADPVAEIAAGFLVFLAGVLLVAPGFLTDALGLLLLLAPVRRHLVRRGTVRHARFVYTFTHGKGPSGGVIEGEYREKGREKAEPGEKRLPGNGGA